jgi:hypothetical protein
MTIKCYRVWFRDGSALLVDATSEAEATDLGANIAREQHNEPWLTHDPHLQVKSVDCLDS